MKRKNKASATSSRSDGRPRRILRDADHRDLGGEMVLNAELFRRLKTHFDSVRVSRRGEARAATVAPSLYGGLDVTVAQPGEQYHARCCFCDDAGQSLSINHMYGQRDDCGRQLTFLAYCHHADCLGLPQNRAALAALLQADDGFLEAAPIRPRRAP